MFACVLCPRFVVRGRSRGGEKWRAIAPMPDLDQTGTEAHVKCPRVGAGQGSKGRDRQSRPAISVRTCGYFLRRREARPAAHAPKASTANVAGSGTSETPPPPGGGGHSEGTSLHVAPACTGEAPNAMNAAAATSANVRFFMFRSTTSRSRAIRTTSRDKQRLGQGG